MLRVPVQSGVEVNFVLKLNDVVGVAVTMRYASFILGLSLEKVDARSADAARPA